MRTTLTALSTVRPTRRLAVSGLTALGAAGIAATALTGTAHAAQPQTQTAGPATHQAAATAQHLTAQADHAAKNTKSTENGKDGGKGEYADNLDGWIREARAIMAKHDIPGSYDGIKRNIIRESAGDPHAVNDWDVNAKKGTPSKGLLQVIQPTFDQYHVKGTPDDLTDPVANIVAACNYAADRYGTMDNVDSAY
ncbi:transglycosylase SLT domain-containing protein [Streptomyces sp. WMMB303]|uniref:transglycosylase SLT domain-containing protein n=1 Tax=Streptomyces sp. WMMB303 TaxID=3034154 RepID=UPI0023EB0183|nr:transglycosylase SLT domain-containing protein [Streptomyces sp. WMMB303]MDF4251374.1 transglycosylase SLT domain-containing protein [Streptomyces sp. WMMB303]MDF4252193.1 transglycosylase SLT domain-containing protein [Streptomyces sp. WMMB303]MDF4253471.1 transglycosylase SLT domain-containing protein [Streptomyces sp. WMMB303]